jgi:ribosomal-protein-alanine N-acetyltransferase
VGDRSHDGPGLTVRRGSRADAPFIVGLGETAFARFGEYATVMREFLGSPHVESFIACSAGEPVGFALVEAPPGQRGVADLVAIAVELRHRRTGVGRALLTTVIASREARDQTSLLVLTVADDNDQALALFRAHGFEMIPGSFGLYAGGQTSRRMARAVRPRPREAR